MFTKSLSKLVAALLAVLIAVAQPAAATETRQCNGELRFAPQNDAMTYLVYDFAVRRTVDHLYQVNDARREARIRLLECTRDHLANWDGDHRPDACTSARRYEVVGYPFEAMGMQVTGALCAANPGQETLLITVELTVTGNTGCVASGSSDAFVMARNLTVSCGAPEADADAAPIGDGGDWECTGPGCAGDDEETVIGDGGGWECVGDDCPGVAPEEDAPPATATYTPLPMFRLPGNDLYLIELDAPNWMLCRQACTEDARCGAWTYRAPTARSGPVCLIKSGAGIPIPDGCCRSGIRR